MRGLLLLLNGAELRGGGAGGAGGGGRQEPAGVADLSFFCPLVRDPNTWGQRGLNGFIVKAASDADADGRRESARAN